MGISQDMIDVVEELQPEFGKHSLGSDDLLRSPVLSQRILRNLRVGSVSDPVGMERGNERHGMAGAPLRVNADEIERVRSGFSLLSRSNGDDRQQKLIAMGLRLLGELVVHGIA